LNDQAGRFWCGGSAGSEITPIKPLICWWAQMFLANIYSALGDNDRPISTCDDVRKFDFPVLLMTGDRSPKKFEFFYNEMRKCREFPATVVTPNAAHGMQRLNPEVFNQVTLEFLSKH
jgi:pimeloyl-ACP methyl ester carboxylesterase